MHHTLAAVTGDALLSDAGDLEGVRIPNKRVTVSEQLNITKGPAVKSVCGRRYRGGK